MNGAIKALQKVMEARAALMADPDDQDNVEAYEEACWIWCDRYGETLLAALEDGVIVPREPTEAMLEAGMLASDMVYREVSVSGQVKRLSRSTDEVATVYRAMLTAKEEG